MHSRISLLLLVLSTVISCGPSSTATTDGTIGQQEEVVLNDSTKNPPPGIVMLNGTLLDSTGMTSSFENSIIAFRSLNQPQSSSLNRSQSSVKTVFADQNGGFQASGITSSEITITTPSGSTSKYEIIVREDLNEGNIDLVIDPIFGSSSTEGIELSPTEANQAGTATILQPQEGQTVICNQLLTDECAIQVTGIASPSLGLIGTPYSTYIVVQPLFPFEGSVYPQDDVISVDPFTGRWEGTAYFGSDDAPIVGGERFNLFMVVTDQPLVRTVNPTAFEFESSVTIEGAVFISRFTGIQFGPRN